MCAAAHLFACESVPAGGTSTTTASIALSSTASAITSSSSAPDPRPLRLIAGGDVDLARARGQRLIGDPSRDDLAPLRPLLSRADIRFANLESTISDRGGETQAAWNALVFSAPPPAADALARASIDVVSLANNHAWDYGKVGLFETFERLERAGVAWVGAGVDATHAHAPILITRRGLKLAFVAATDVWNQRLSPHPGRRHIADADRESFLRAIRAARALPDVDKVVVSFHGGEEYFDEPLDGTRALLGEAIDAGADVVLGHHPHVIQRVAFRDGKPIFFSLGNLLMRMVTDKEWTEFGMLADLELSRMAPTAVRICPFRIEGLDLVPLAGDPRRAATEAYFRARFVRLLDRGALQDPSGAATLGDFTPDGCAPVTPR